MKDLLTEEYLEEITEELNGIIRDMSNETVGIIADRLKEYGKLKPEEIEKIKEQAKREDLKKIDYVIAVLLAKAIKETPNIFDKVARKTEDVAKEFYEYRGKEQVHYSESKILKEIVDSAEKNAEEILENLSGTRAFMVNGKYTELSKAYINAVNEAVRAVSAGDTDYYTYMRRTVKRLSQSGLTVVDYESGYHRRLDSAVRMNILDGTRQMSLKFREQQAKEYGADGWEISAHALCRPDHVSSQGKVFSFEEFEKLQRRLATPIATGQYNCKHMKTGVIMEINQPAYSKEELDELERMSNEKVTFTGLSGKKITKSRYECSQYMRTVETSIRELKDQRDALERFGDVLEVKKIKKEITARTKEYKRICSEMGITPRLNRL